jgi:hypothetical protein
VRERQPPPSPENPGHRKQERDLPPESYPQEWPETYHPGLLEELSPGDDPFEEIALRLAIDEADGEAGDADEEGAAEDRRLAEYRRRRREEENRRREWELHCLVEAANFRRSALTSKHRRAAWYLENMRVIAGARRTPSKRTSLEGRRNESRPSPQQRPAKGELGGKGGSHTCNSQRSKRKHHLGRTGRGIHMPSPR